MSGGPFPDPAPRHAHHPPLQGPADQVRVLADGFEYLGERYRSLSAIAKQITGSHCSGNRFFQLTNTHGDQ